RIDSGLDANRNNSLDTAEIQATEYLCEGGSATSGQKVVDANGDVLGDALASDSVGITLRTSTGHIVTLSWNGQPAHLRFVDFAGANCSGDAKIYMEDVVTPIHEQSAFWSEAHSGYLVPSGTVV